MVAAVGIGGVRVHACAIVAVDIRWCGALLAFVDSVCVCVRCCHCWWWVLWCVNGSGPVRVRAWLSLLVASLCACSGGKVS